MKSAPIKTGSELFAYIPQRPPFVMVDALYEKGDTYVKTGFSLLEDNILVQGGLLQEGGLVENIAQTAALFAGVSYIDKGLPAPLGFIAGIKDLEVRRLPAVGTTIYTRTTFTHDLGSIQVVAGEVVDEQEQLLARCELRIFIKGEE